MPSSSSRGGSDPQPPPAGGLAPFGPAAALFVLSGVGALVVETTWLRWFRLLLGGTAPAASATLVAFFTGQALGAALGGRWAASRPRPLRAYALLQGAALLASAAVPGLLSLLQTGLDSAYDPLRRFPAALVATRFAVALAATLPASTAFGATLPVMTAAVVGRPGGLGTRGAALYALQTAGAALGVALASFWLPEAWGIRGGYAAGLCALALAAVGALALSGARLRPLDTGPSERQRPGSSVRWRSSALETLAALSGFASFAAQVLLVQAFALVLNQSTYAFGSVLFVVLLCLAAGGLVCATVATSGRLDPGGLLVAALLGAGLGLALLPALFVAGTDGLTYLGSDRPWPGYLLQAVGLAASVAGPPLLAAALVFPSLLGVAARLPGKEGAARRIGRLVAWNTAGAVAGASTAPYVLLPSVGLWGGFAALGALYAAAACALPTAGSRGRLPRLTFVAAAAGAVAVWANPAALPLLRVEADERLIHAAHTPAGIVAVLERDGERLIQIDNHYALGGTRDRVHQERQGHVPLLLHPDAGRVLFLGSATGGSAAAALLHPVRSLSLVELVPGVARAAARFFGAANRDVYRSRRTEVVLDDARSFVRSTRARFDLIVGDLFVPWRSGTGALFTLEHFAAIRDRLAADGLFCQWLPLYQLSEEEFRVIAATFLDVFPRAAIFRGDFYGAFPIVALVGWAGTPPSPERIGAASVRLAEEPVDDRWVTSPIGFWSLYVGPLRGLGPALAEVPRNRDDRPELEFRAARTHAGGARGKRDPFVALRWIAFVDRLRAGARRSGDDVFGDLPPAAARAAAGGQALQLAGALYTAGRVDESSSAVAAAATLLPSHLLADAPPDPTAADVWPADR